MDWKKEVENFLTNSSEEKLAEFHRRLVDTKHKIYGVRTLALKNFAKALSKENCPVDAIKPNSHEEILIRGFLLSNCKYDDKKTIAELKKFLDEIDNWATCDMIVGSLKNLTSEYAFNFFIENLSKPSPFKKRVGIVGIMDYFLCDEKLDVVIENLLKIDDENYYVKMAIAWLLCTLICKNYEYGVFALQKFQDKFVRNKAISKCQDSFRLDKEKKEKLKKLRIS